MVYIYLAQNIVILYFVITLYLIKLNYWNKKYSIYYSYYV